MIPLPLDIKLLLPGYRARWRARYACMLAELEALAPSLTYGEDDGTPWIELAQENLRLFGFRTELKNAEVYRILRGALPPSIPLSHFRLVKDCLNRYVYPHMRPDLKPAEFATEAMFGFHGQHKDAIADLADADAREKLSQAFVPRPDDVVIDCGPFLGFGELRIAPALVDGHMFAVEADRACHALLSRNMSHNGIENVTVLHRAVWDSETELDLQSDFAQANSLVSEVHIGAEVERVRTITIDAIVEAHSIQKLDMLSLTLNGAEVEAIKGAERTLTNLRPRIRLAGWYARGGRKISAITKDQLEALGYQVFIGPRNNTMALPV
ncbi:MAG: FkbM family methyltransferase [Rhodospirillaceae bacterium]|jgi:FkbM family methyltransferase|nr:FkbM family methyltransferase [Rhodospirillaceae bacterium]MBT3627467.1 FkbM family methyltransferase [Rhodospirillaceae bacterium]MBT3927147.1 FkbM family methyltransferase [Rhodospirillaceae bacterium]MBT4428072.1 FkbM family methyltransferase [Rhodospirillaceae bacterium]MBT5038305.1 FkbM family methyltransferase [Rhodospirillaceae bacterium]